MRYRAARKLHAEDEVVIVVPEEGEKAVGKVVQKSDDGTVVTVDVVVRDTLHRGIPHWDLK